MEVIDLNKNFANGGDEEFNFAIELYGHQLLRYSHNILCNYADAQDAVQTTFIKAFVKRKKFVHDKSLSSWLYRIAYTTCLDMLRKKNFLFLEDLLDFKEKPQNNETDLNYISDDLLLALKSLSPKERALVFNRAIDELDYLELEKIYNTSAATLRKRYERAKNKLAKKLINTNVYNKNIGMEEQK